MVKMRHKPPTFTSDVLVKYKLKTTTKFTLQLYLALTAKQTPKGSENIYYKANIMAHVPQMCWLNKKREHDDGRT